MTKKILFKGCGTAISTPFNENGVNFKEFERLIQNQIQNKVDALIVCGTTGEASTMSKKEKMETIAFSVKTAQGKIPIIAGTGGNNTKQVLEYSKEIEDLGVDGLLIVTPYYNKCTQNGLIQHYKEIAKNVSIPIILYNVPSRTGVNIEPKTCFELSKIENIVAIKEASGNLSQVAEIAHLCGDHLAIYSGNDDQVLPVLSLGGIGVISVLSNILPQYTHDIVQNFLDGNISIATRMQLDVFPLIKALFSEVNPIPVKAALNILGYDYGIPRLPLTPMNADQQIELKNVLSKFIN